jgi:hypothetical protein
MVQEQEIEEKSGFNFKASEFNRKILSQVSCLPNVMKRELTAFKEFNLSKPVFQGEKENENVPKFEFKARPLDQKILKEATFKPEINN